MRTAPQIERKYVKLARVHRSEDEGHAVVLKIGNQSFELNCPGDLVTARTGGHCHQFARKIIEILGSN